MNTHPRSSLAATGGEGSSEPSTSSRGKMPDIRLLKESGELFKADKA